MVENTIVRLRRIADEMFICISIENNSGDEISLRMGLSRAFSEEGNQLIMDVFGTRLGALIRLSTRYREIKRQHEEQTMGIVRQADSALELF